MLYANRTLYYIFYLYSPFSCSVPCCNRHKETCSSNQQEKETPKQEEDEDPKRPSLIFLDDEEEEIVSEDKLKRLGKWKKIIF